MSVTPAEVVLVQFFIGKQIQHLDGKSRRTFPEILNEIVGRLREEDFKLTRVAKSYRREGLNLLRWLLEEKRRIGSVEVV